MGRELASADDLALADGALFHTRAGRPVDLPAPLAPLADSHGHLTVFEGHDPAMAIARAALAGVCLLVVPVDPTEDATDAALLHASLAAWQARAAELLDAFSARGVEPPDFPSSSVARPGGLPGGVVTVAGVHPCGAASFDDRARRTLGALLDHEGCRGVGEIGLDYTCDVDHDVQEAVFREQLALAVERDLPVELHVRDERGDEGHAAHAAALSVLEDVGVPPAGCDLHCFTCGVDVMSPFVDLGCLVAFGGAVTFRRSDDIRAAAAACPSAAILSETDCPYMAPVPLRGEECEPAMVALSARCVADVREEAGVATRQATYDALWANAARLYRLG